MIVLLGQTGEMSLRAAEDLQRFSVRHGGDVPPVLARGVRVEGDHAWIPIDAIRELGPQDDAAWLAGFDAMVDYARTKGWVDEATRTIRGHIETGTL